MNKLLELQRKVIDKLGTPKVVKVADTSEIQGCWHARRTYRLDNYRELVVCGMITGCGIAQMYGVASIFSANLEKAKDVLKKIKADYKKDGCGVIVATLGCGYYDSEPYLLKAGFERQIEYRNWRHSGDDTQRLYTLTIK